MTIEITSEELRVLYEAANMAFEAYREQYDSCVEYPADLLSGEEVKVIDPIVAEIAKSRMQVARDLTIKLKNELEV